MKTPINTIYVVRIESGWHLQDDNDTDYGVTDTLEEAIKSAKEYVRMGVATNYCVGQ